jgi:hypothetical protein
VLGFVSLFLFQFVFAEETSVKRNCEGTEIAMFREQLTLIPSPYVLMRNNVEKKVEAWETMISICETITPAIVNPNETPQFIPWTPAPFETGIFEGQTGDIHSFDAKIENHWEGIVNWNYLTVFAGALANDPGQGIIIMHITSPVTSKTDGNRYLSQTKSGALRIMEAKGDVLVIQPSEGDRLYFNVLAQQFVPSLTDNPPEKDPFIVNTSTPASPLYP